MKQNGLGCSVRKRKREGQEKVIRYCKAMQTWNHIIWKSAARTHIRLIISYINYSYKFGNMTQEYGFHPRLTDIDEWRTLHRCQGHIPAWVHAQNWCQKHDVYAHWLSGNDQRKGRWIALLWMPACLIKRKVAGTTDDGQPLLSPTDCENV